ncbi:MAG: magnesium and cobalt exporter, family [Verrucomicrobiota bacterium]|jgi:CBS domain containing-hemolysin-like protein
MMTWLAILGCWAISFLFSGIEAGLLSIDPVRLRNQVKQHQRAALRLNRLLKSPERLLVTVLLVTNMADILGLLLLTRRLVSSFGYQGYFLALLIALPIYLFVLAVLPKLLFRRFPFRALARLASLLEVVWLILWPLLELGSLLRRVFFGQRTGEHGRLFAVREEWKQITAQSEREGSITATERAMIHNVVDFRGIKARDVMVPMPQVVAVRPDATIAETIELARTTNVDRLPVITKEGNAQGLVNVLDVLLDKNGDRPLTRYIRRIVTANEDEPAFRIVQRLRAARLGLAALIDRQNNLIGIVTIEDLIRRLVSLSEARG